MEKEYASLDKKQPDFKEVVSLINRWHKECGKRSFTMSEIKTKQEWDKTPASEQRAYFDNLQAEIRRAQKWGKEHHC